MKNISREFSFTISFTQLLINILGRGACFSFLIVPAMFFGCSRLTEAKKDDNIKSVKSRLKSIPMEDYEIRSLDAFFFERDKNGILDCYQRIDDPESICDIASGSGQKTLVIIANSPNDKYDWTNIKNLRNISEVTINLETESLDSPVMSSILSTTAGEPINLNLIPLRSEIVLRSIRCDFSGKPYSNEDFTLTRAYLTYVNASCRIIPEEITLPSRIINAGVLDEEHLKSFIDRDMIVKEFNQVVKTTPSYLDCSLYCYANNSIEESIGTPFTKLVIEGMIGDDTYYYPIKINSENGGISHGNRYIFDIVLTRTGTLDPDGRIVEGDISINMEVEAWREKDSYCVKF